MKKRALESLQYMAMAGARFYLINSRCDMEKKWLLIGVVVLSVSVMVVGCGVPQEKHDAVIAE